MTRSSNLNKWVLPRRRDSEGFLKDTLAQDKIGFEIQSNAFRTIETCLKANFTQKGFSTLGIW
eukprot:CAMPEP_0194303074 /NCGR_PEP_ID=MMETSP0171-20130528/993_1 /TAXON_ID=218684 /ORGANISM="Corethron pennatum, Strain L29A3" /LENGTH=62 /DNA_ID=CAMNT_0039053813 /DNA_START=129 /DNA_END=314 /DNA_ORIENTATION=-